MPMRETVETPAGRVSYLREDGAGSTVLLLHGNSSCAEIFRRQIAALASAGYAALAPDLPGHGASEDAATPERTYSFPGYAAAISCLLDRLDLTAVHLVGWSLGGHVAMELALSEPRISSALVTGAPPIRPGPAALRDAFQGTPDMALAGARRFCERDARLYVSAMLGGVALATPALIAAALRTDGAARWHMVENGVAGVGADETALLADPPTPFAIVQGDRDPFLRNDYLLGLDASRLWRGRLHWLPGLGHAPHWEAPEAFNAVLLEFLDDVESVSTTCRREFPQQRGGGAR